MKKLFVILTLILVLSGCEFFTGKKVTSTDSKTGKVTVTYEDAPVEDWIKIITLAVPALGVAGVAAAQIARNAMRAKDGLLDANEEAIENADWKQINSKESFKELLKLYQSSHDDAKLIDGQYKKWNAKRKKRTA